MREAQTVVGRYLLEYCKDENAPNSLLPAGHLKVAIAHFGAKDNNSLPLESRPYRVLAIARECIAEFISHGRYVVFPDKEVDDEMAIGKQHDPRQGEIDACALDAEIRSAVESTGLVNTYIAGFGDDLKARVRGLAVDMHKCIAGFGTQFNCAEGTTGNFSEPRQLAVA